MRKQTLFSRLAAIICLLVALALCAKLVGADKPAPAANSTAPVIRCLVIGGMTDTGLWEALVARFEKQTGLKTEVIATGPKHEIAEPFKRGEADLITMHASDTIINLVADGYGADPQPWARNDLMLVGPASDPAGVKGMTDAVAALKKIIASKSKYLIHQSVGANEVLRDLLAAGDLDLDEQSTVTMATDRNRLLLKRAADENAYTIVGRIPYLNGKIVNHGLVIMVQGDPRMRRPYIVAVRNGKTDDPRIGAARRLAAFMRSEETQRWLAEFGRGDLDDRPIFFPVVLTPQAPENDPKSADDKAPAATR